MSTAAAITSSASELIPVLKEGENPVIPAQLRIVSANQHATPLCVEFYLERETKLVYGCTQ